MAIERQDRAQPVKRLLAFLNRFDLSDIALLAAGFCWGIAFAILWCRWDQPEKWDIGILTIAFMVWIGFGYACLQIALFFKNEESS